MTRKAIRLGTVAALIAVAAATMLASSYAGSDTTSTYIVLYKQSAVPADAAGTIQAAGGTLVNSYDEIGVAIARSGSSSFAASMLANSKVEGATATEGFATRLSDELEVADASIDAPVSDTDPLSSQQWDMIQIHTPEAHAITGGSPSVTVGDIDTGVDYTHPDLAANIDFANSVSCVSGVPNQDPAAWNDDNGHGTHTAGTIAAAANGIGIVGVAPNVKLAGIKAGNADGYFFPEAIICSFMWAGSHGIDVTNNSYFADPWLFNCRNDPEQRAIWKAEQRAIRYAMQKGVTVVAAEGNENLDLSKQNVDTISPDTDPNPAPREVTNACVVIPVEIPGVIGVTANGNLMQKSYYSSYGVSVTQVVAPGGDSRFQRTAAAPRGTVLSTFPGNRYAFAQGTSMASPHVAGVAALIDSQFGKLPPGAVAARIANSADPQACPPNPFNPGPPFNYAAVCQGGAGYNGFYGHGQVNALGAIS
jgi:lantibiotic leader peptide-processing serine protease